MFLSTCLTILVRLTLFSDREDQTDDAIWQGAVLNLRRLLNTLTEAQKKYDWDIASLALSRAAYFVPLLQDQIPELSVVLQPFVSSLLRCFTVRRLSHRLVPSPLAVSKSSSSTLQRRSTSRAFSTRSRSTRSPACRLTSWSAFHPLSPFPPALHPRLWEPC